ncbi:MAG: serine/threonine protein kinase [bacterium]|jgi:serine/threonine protein kinase
MILDPKDILDDHRKSNRWEIISKNGSSSNAFNEYKVLDKKFDRELFLSTINYNQASSDDSNWLVESLRESMKDTVKNLAKDYNFLPKIVEWLQVENTIDSMNFDLRNEEPILIYQKPKTYQLNALKIPDDLGRLKKIVIQILYNLKELHQNKVVIRVLSKKNIQIDATTYKPFFSNFSTLIHTKSFKGYNKNKITFKISRKYASPECFQANGKLTPATDIYALGKLILTLVKNQNIPIDQPEEKLQEYINASPFPRIWKRFLSICLKERPDLRFLSAENAIAFLQGKQSTNQPLKRKESSFKKESYSSMPSALLIVWDKNLMARGDQLDFEALIQNFEKKLNVNKRLYFHLEQPKREPVDQNIKNPFFSLLERKFKMKCFPTKQRNIKDTVLTEVEKISSNFKHIILVGDAQEYALQCLFQSSALQDCQIHWIKAGTAQAPIVVQEQLEIQQFIKKKHKK